ncbi:uncharacterized protein LOC118189582 isoform X2 [Stegodyphus dumicola]|uniref:uncharacterized protein LOC118189582 isoform X2 n=1 Tax=Stegodyphus dumicola TaxID=202533 RepID=UPI0015ACB53F|nr:uncharacterized protein LOC118189582 isoform X2 [Stegodyphus dumicola]
MNSEKCRLKNHQLSNGNGINKKRTNCRKKVHDKNAAPVLASKGRSNFILQSCNISISNSSALSENKSQTACAKQKKSSTKSNCKKHSRIKSHPEPEKNSNSKFLILSQGTDDGELNLAGLNDLSSTSSVCENMPPLKEDFLSVTNNDSADENSNSSSPNLKYMKSRSAKVDSNCLGKRDNKCSDLINHDMPESLSGNLEIEKLNFLPTYENSGFESNSLACKLDNNSTSSFISDPGLKVDQNSWQFVKPLSENVNCIPVELASVIEEFASVSRHYESKFDLLTNILKLDCITNYPDLNHENVPDIVLDFHAFEAAYEYYKSRKSDSRSGEGFNSLNSECNTEVAGECSESKNASLNSVNINIKRKIHEDMPEPRKKKKIQEHFTLHTNENNAKEINSAEDYALHSSQSLGNMSSDFMEALYLVPGQQVLTDELEVSSCSEKKLKTNSSCHSKSERSLKSPKESYSVKKCKKSNSEIALKRNGVLLTDGIHNKCHLQKELNEEVSSNTVSANENSDSSSPNLNHMKSRSANVDSNCLCKRDNKHSDLINHDIPESLSGNLEIETLNFSPTYKNSGYESNSLACKLDTHSTSSFISDPGSKVDQNNKKFEDNILSDILNYEYETDLENCDEGCSRVSDRKVSVKVSASYAQINKFNNPLNLAESSEEKSNIEGSVSECRFNDLKQAYAIDIPNDERTVPFLSSALNAQDGSRTSTTAENSAKDSDGSEEDSDSDFEPSFKSRPETYDNSFDSSYDEDEEPCETSSIPYNNEKDAVKNNSRSKISDDHFKDVKGVIDAIRNNCQHIFIMKAIDVAKQYIAVSLPEIKKYIFEELFLNVVKCIKEPSNNIAYSTKHDFMVNTIGLMKDFSLYDENLSTLVIKNCFELDFEALFVELFKSCIDMNIPLKPEVFDPYAGYLRSSNVDIDELLHFLLYVKNVCCYIDLPVDMCCTVLDKCAAGNCDDECAFRIFELLPEIDSQKVEMRCVKNFLQYCCEKEFWHQISKIVMASHSKSSFLLHCLLQTFVDQIDVSGKYFEKFAAAFHGMEEPCIEYKSLLGQLGTCLMLNADYKEHLSSAVHVLHILHFYNINYYELQMPVINEEVCEKDVLKEDFFIFPYKIVFRAIDIFLRAGRPKDAYLVFEGYSWIKPDENVVPAFRSTVITERFSHLIKLVQALHLVDPLDKGWSVLQIIATSVKDLLSEELSHYIKDLELVYNQYMITFLNEKEVDLAYELFRSMCGPLQTILNVKSDVIRGLIVSLAESGMRHEAKRLFMLHVMIYPIEKPQINSFPWCMTVMSNWTSHEVFFAIQFYFEALFPTLENKNKEIAFEKWYSVRFKFKETPDSPIINCLKIPSMHFDSLAAKIRTVLKKLNSKLEIIEDKFEKCLSIKPQSFYNFWKTKYPNSSPELTYRVNFRMDQVEKMAPCFGKGSVVQNAKNFNFQSAADNFLHSMQNTLIDKALSPGFASKYEGNKNDVSCQRKTSLNYKISPQQTISEHKESPQKRSPNCNKSPQKKISKYKDSLQTYYASDECKKVPFVQRNTLKSNQLGILPFGQELSPISSVCNEKNPESSDKNKILPSQNLKNNSQQSAYAVNVCNQLTRVKETEYSVARQKSEDITKPLSLKAKTKTEQKSTSSNRKLKIRRLTSLLRSPSPQVIKSSKLVQRYKKPAINKSSKNFENISICLPGNALTRTIIINPETNSSSADSRINSSSFAACNNSTLSQESVALNCERSLLPNTKISISSNATEVKSSMKKIQSLEREKKISSSTTTFLPKHSSPGIVVQSERVKVNSSTGGIEKQPGSSFKIKLNQSQYSKPSFESGEISSSFSFENIFSLSLYYCKALLLKLFKNTFW